MFPWDFLLSLRFLPLFFPLDLNFRKVPELHFPNRKINPKLCFVSPLRPQVTRDRKMPYFYFPPSSWLFPLLSFLFFPVALLFPSLSSLTSLRARNGPIYFFSLRPFLQKKQPVDFICSRKIIYNPPLPLAFFCSLPFHIMFASPSQFFIIKFSLFALISFSLM